MNDGAQRWFCTSGANNAAWVFNWTASRQPLRSIPAIRDTLGAEQMLMTPPKFDAYIQAEIGSNAAVVKATAITVNRKRSAVLS